MKDEIIHSYCAYCIDREDFHIFDGVWLCDKCNRPLKRATQPAENKDKFLQSKSMYGTIVTGVDYG